MLEDCGYLAGEDVGRAGGGDLFGRNELAFGDQFIEQRRIAQNTPVFGSAGAERPEDFSVGEEDAAVWVAKRAGLGFELRVAHGFRTAVSRCRPVRRPLRW
uniref:Unannotated protein n=1 Tax=freshwater metagenome TaxID=449393 RepID=A0A6J5ZWQ8_9ZZZZ